ncbi:hypothetical protein MMAD_18960 [Mycolicibacterium madagascariense]|uniref:Uncharacterized protein n=1 Tax=Mycolicibacterium madagascariense TaxID=212765 RepID=A0A7I7XEJ9_9MYCO|nr:hypothetical protein [Mycolicibacterium madagascariense]MCV7015306.1 hypothetical protein [Mycolicibacterium madagascariense]BBZ27601.1 hypothetical protein MMAD_18960 [Mycolicibacterium madagascariense]
MITITAPAARLFVGCLLTAGIVGGSLAGAVAVPLADGPVTTATDPAAPISGKTGAPLGDATFGADPLVPFGTDPQPPVTPGYVDRDHDNGVTANGEVDLPF